MQDGVSCSTWSPLFSSITLSSIWETPKHVRLLWITLLALKDNSGIVVASLPGLVRAAALTREEVEDAIEVLMAPDPDSSNPENGGRRIEKIVGGWRVLSHEIYQAKMRKISKRIGDAKRQRDKRARQKPLKGETETLALLREGKITQDEADERAARI